MSMVMCACGWPIDSDDDPECFGPDDSARCQWCRGEEDQENEEAT